MESPKTANLLYSPQTGSTFIDIIDSVLSDFVGFEDVPQTVSFVS